MHFFLIFDQQNTYQGQTQAIWEAGVKKHPQSADSHDAFMVKQFQTLVKI